MSFPTTGLGLPWLLLSTPTPPLPRATEHTAGYSQVSAESPVLPPMASPTTASPNPQVLLGVMLRRSYLLMATSWCPAWFPTSPRASPPSSHPRMLGSLVSPAWLHGSTRAKSHGEVFYKRGGGGRGGGHCPGGDLVGQHLCSVSVQAFVLQQPTGAGLWVRDPLNSQ